MADDMFLSCKLDGWMYRDRGIQIAYSIPGSLGGEARKRVRQEIACQRYFEYYRREIGDGRRVAFFDEPLDNIYRWTGFGMSQVLGKLTEVNGAKSKMLIGLSMSMRLVAKMLAQWKIRSIRREPTIDYWDVER